MIDALPFDIPQLIEVAGISGTIAIMLLGVFWVQARANASAIHEQSKRLEELSREQSKRLDDLSAQNKYLQGKIDLLEKEMDELRKAHSQEHINALLWKARAVHVAKLYKETLAQNKRMYNFLEQLSEKKKGH